MFDALLITSFILGYAARYVHPSTLWWPELFSIALPYFSLLLAGVFAARLLRRRLRSALLYGVLVVLVALRFLPWGDPSWFEKESAEDLVLLTLNLPGPERVGLPHRVQGERLQALMEWTQPHLAGFQEAVHLRSTFGIGPDLCYRWAAPDAPYCLRQSRKMPVTFDPRQVLVSRIPIDSISYIPLEHREEGAHANHYTRVAFKWQGRPAVLYVVHLQSYHAPARTPTNLTRPTPRIWIDRILGSRAAFIARAEEARQIARAVAAERVPVIVSGDFNSTAHNWAFHHIARSLQDSYRLAGTRWGATWHDAFPFARIDFVLASKEWDVVAARVANTSLSDHRPLTVRLRLKAPEAAGSP